MTQNPLLNHQMTSLSAVDDPETVDPVTLNIPSLQNGE
jgi:hypothetical protein